MAATRNIKQQLADLEKKAAELRKIQDRIISDIRKQIAQYALTPEDLFPSSSSLLPVASTPEVVAKPSKTISPRKNSKPTATKKPASVPKYMDPKTGKTWTGHGKAPSWIAPAVKKGRKDEFLIAAVQARIAAKASPKPVKNIPATSKKAPAKLKKPAAPSTTAKKPSPVIVATPAAARTAIKKKPAVTKATSQIKRKAPVAATKQKRVPATTGTASSPAATSPTPAADIPTGAVSA